MNSPINETAQTWRCDPNWDYAEIYIELIQMLSKVEEAIGELESDRAQHGNPQTDFRLCKIQAQIEQQAKELRQCLSEPQTSQSRIKSFLEQNCNQNQLMIQRLESLSDQLSMVNTSLLTIKTNMSLLALPMHNKQQQS